MKAMPFHLQGKRNSLLHMRTSPSPPTSASSFNGGAAGGFRDGREKVVVKDEWGVAELQPLPNCRVGLEDWESMLSMPKQDQAFMRLVSGGDMVSGNNLFNSIDFSGNGVGSLGIVNQGPGFETNLAAFSSFEFDNGGLQSPDFCSQASSVSNEGFGMLEEKLLNLNPGMFPQNPNFLVPLVFPQENHPLQPQLKRQNARGVEAGAFSDLGQEFLLRKQQQQQQQQQQEEEQQTGLPQALQFLQQSPQKPIVVKKEEEEVETQQHYHQQQQHVLLDQLYKAAELVEAENFSHAQGILARLNQQLSPIGKPLQRAAFYFKEALQLLLFMSGNSIIALPPLNPTPLDIVSKFDAYKAFSEMSPLVQFVNFTCNQVLLEAIGDADRIHVIDFDINTGANWASFMLELPQSRGATTLKITAFASPRTHHPVELALIRDSLTQFANDLGIMFELDVINIDSLDDNCFSLPISRQYLNEAIAVNFPVWSSSRQPNALPMLLCIVKQLSPKIVVSIDGECSRFDRPFPQHVLHAVQSYIHLLESLEAVNGCTDAVNKIERFIIQPRIESIVLGCLRMPNRMPNWKTIFASAGFSPVHFSNFTATQAECIVKRSKGFLVEKQQASLMLRWQQHELICASAWRC